MSEEQTTILNKLQGMSTFDDARDIPIQAGRLVQNFVVYDGQEELRKGFSKVNATKYGAAITGLYNYRTRYGKIFNIIGSDTDLRDAGHSIQVTLPDTIEVDSAFNVTVTKLDYWGNQDYNYNGTVSFTEDGDGSLTGGNATLVQGTKVHSLTYTGGSAGTLTITATDTVDSSITGSDSTTVTLNPFTLAYTLSSRASHYIKSRTTAGGTSIYDSKLYFVSGQEDAISALEGNSQDIEVISINTSDTGTIEATLSGTDLYFGQCITTLNGDLYVGTGLTGDLYKSTDGSTFNSVANLGSVIYCLYAHGAKYYAATGYAGSIQETSDLSSWSSSLATGDVSAMRFIEFGGDLYAGTSKGQEALGGGYGIFKLSGGSWSDVYSGSLTQIFGMEVLGSYMYIGEHDENSATGGIVKRTNDGSSYSTVLSTNQDFPYCMCIHDSKIYIGCADGLIYYSSNGTDWSNSTSPTDQDIFAISSFNSKLFITTQNKIYSFNPS